MGIERDEINEVFFLGLGETGGLCAGWDDPDDPDHYVENTTELIQKKLMLY